MSNVSGDEEVKDQTLMDLASKWNASGLSQNNRSPPRTPWFQSSSRGRFGQLFSQRLAHGGRVSGTMHFPHRRTDQDPEQLLFTCPVTGNLRGLLPEYPDHRGFDLGRIVPLLELQLLEQGLRVSSAVHPLRQQRLCGGRGDLPRIHQSHEASEGGAGEGKGVQALILEQTQK